MKREIKFSLVFRDMWQSAGKYVPTVDQLTRVAPAIIEMLRPRRDQWRRIRTSKLIIR